ncbi:MAG: AAA family ATPase, partial [archaeon]|nr:AAA family ATPase [archaeon]
MSLRIAQLMGKSKDPIVKYVPLNVKEYSHNLEEALKRKSQKKREEEKSRTQKLLKSEKEMRNRQGGNEKNNVEIDSNPNLLCASTVTFDYAVEEPKIPDIYLEEHELREKKEKLEVLKLNKQYFDISFHPFHKYYYTPYAKKPYEISCFNQFSDDTTNIFLLDQDYEESYEEPPPSIKNLGRYDCWEDEPPEVLLEKCKKMSEETPHALSPMYDYMQEKFMWNPAYVLDYLKDKMKYKIKFLTTEKEVPRLSLVFIWEVRAEFDYRKYLCEKRRTNVDQNLLFTRYVDNVPDEFVAPLTFDWQKKIETKIKYTTKNAAKRFNELFTEDQDRYQRQLGIVAQDYLRQMKMCRILTEMQEPTNANAFKGRSLELRPFFKNVPTQKKGIVNRSSDMERKMAEIKDRQGPGKIATKKDDYGQNLPLFLNGYFAKEMLTYLMHETQQMTHINLIISTLEDIPLPFKLKQFKDYFNACKSNTIDKMKKLSSKQLASFLKECDDKAKKEKEANNATVKTIGSSSKKQSKNETRSPFDFYCNSREIYEQSVGKRVVSYFNNLIRDKAKEMIDNSIVSFMNTFKIFGKCKYGGTERNLLYEKLGTHYLESRLPLFSSKLITKKISKEERHKKIETKELEFKPSLTECKDALIEAFTEIKNRIITLTDLGPQCFRMLQFLEEKVIFELNDDYPLYKQALDELNAMIDDSITEAEKIREEYKPFLEVLELSEKQYIETKLGKSESKLLDVGKCSEILRNLREMEEQLKHKVTETDLRMFRISTLDLKQEIEKKISSLILQMLEKMSKHCEEKTKKIDVDKKKMLDVLKMDIGDDFKKYDELQRLIVTINDFITEKVSELRNVDDVLEQIEEQKHLDIKPAELYMGAVQGWTVSDDLNIEGKVATENLNAKKYDLTKKVEESKASFKKKIVELESLFELISKVDNFKQKIDGKEVSKMVDECCDEIRKNTEEMDTIQGQRRILAFGDEQQEAEAELPDFEKLIQIKKDFEPFNILWTEEKDTMTEYFSKVNEKTLIELKDPPTGKQSESGKEEFTYVKGLEESLKKVDDVNKANAYDTTIVKLCTILRGEIEEYKSYNWMIENLNSVFLRDEDWKEIKAVTKDDKIDNKCKLKELREKDIDRFKPNIELIRTKAFRRQKFITEYKKIWKAFNEIHAYPKDDTNTSLKNIDDRLAELDELGSNLVNIMSNPVTQSDPKLRQDTRALNEKIKNSQMIFEEISKVQANFLYLYPIFNASEINKALASEKADFDKVNVFWSNLMATMEGVGWEFASFMEKENFSNLYSNLCKNTGDLQNIIIRLNQYLNTKRAEFPRFYFVSDEDLLKILAQSKNPLLVQPHLSKCFEGIHHVIFNENNTIIQRMVSSKGEEIPLINEINVVSDQCRGNVEVWLGLLEHSMIDTMKDIAKKCIADLSGKERIKWMEEMKWPGQIVQIIDQVVWTNGVETHLEKGDLPVFLEQLNHELSQVVDLVRGKISMLLSRLLSCIIVISVHAKDTVEKLIEGNVEKITDFDWKAQMRYYFHNEDEDEENDRKKKKKTEVCPISVSMITTVLNYGFEYLGDVTRLVITPLTDRCFRTLFGAYNVQYGGAPEGPAGTGKTESVKDLAKCVGVMCNVFNCTEGIKIQGMSKFFKGLASSGCWCCFDEFNRIDTEVLSVIAQQILTIQTALKAKLNYFYFEENEQILLRETCAINITMNPSYSGRNELPDNLKALFRSVSMMVPDYSLIAEIKLYSFGFQTAKPLSLKITTSLKLSSEQLSSQAHYDFGMRALNAIIVAAGNEKKKNANVEVEDRIVLKALMDVNIAKFTTNDTELFKDLVHDLFPTTTQLESDLGSLEEKIKVISVENNLQPTSNFVKKCIQLWQTMNVRHSLMVVGKPGHTKSKVLDTLKKSVTALKEEPGYNIVETIALNPKSIFQKNLYGYFDITQEWKKGLLQVKMVELCEKEKEQYKWLIFDGPVDTLWIENMNSLLDDNKKLCLEDSSAIFLADNMNIVFEVDDLSEASPATVSRNGMVLCEQDTISTDDLILSYTTTLPNEKFFENPKIINQFKENAIWITNTVLEYLNRNNIEFGLPCDKFHLVKSFLEIFDCYMKDYKNDDFILTPDRIITVDKMDNLLISCLILGILGPVKKNKEIQRFLKDMCVGSDVNTDYNLNFNKELSTNLYKWDTKRLSTSAFENLDNVFENVYLIETGKWHKWVEMPGREAFKIKPELKFNDLVIPTLETIKMGWLITMVVPIKKHLLFTGNTGTGKTLTVLNTLSNNYDNDQYTYIKMSMTAQTTAAFTQEVIEKKLQKGYRKFTPHGGKKAVIFVDDLNMPQKEKFGSQPPIEILRQWMDYGGWYDLVSDNKDFVRIMDVSFLASMGSISSGRTITARYMRHFIIHYADNYAKETMENIYDNIVQWFFAKTEKPSLSSSITGMKEDLIKSTIQMYNEVASTFKATPAKTHYQFNLRDISRVFLGISRANGNTLIEENDMLSLWIHECERIFKDKLVNKEDRDSYQRILSRVMKTSMRRDNPFEGQELLWGDFVEMIFIDNDPKKGVLKDQYCELKNTKLLKETLEKKLTEYNKEIGSRSEGGGPLSLVLFDYAIQHLSRILRIISTYNGNAVLVGVGGSGRKSLTKLATFIYGFTLKQREGDWRDYLKNNIFLELGNKEFVFLVSDSQVDDKQIEDINNMLNNGEVPNLIESQELQTIKDSIPPEFTQGKKLQNDQDIMGAFIENCKAKIHIVFCMSPIGDSFRKRILTFPSLVSCTTIDWYLAWPKEALASVAQHYLGDLEAIDEKMLNDIVEICVDMQNTVITASEKYYQELRRRNYVTPMSFIELLNLFKHLLQKRKEEIKKEIERYGNGVDVIILADKTAADVEEMIKQLQPVIDEKTKLTEKKKEELTILGEQLAVAEEEGKKQEAEAEIVKADAEAKNEVASKTAAEMEEKRETTKKNLASVKASEILELQSSKPDKYIQRFCYYGMLLMIKNPKPKPKPNSDPKAPPVIDYHEYFVKNVLSKMIGAKFLKYLQSGFDVTKMPESQMQEFKKSLEEDDFDPLKKGVTLDNIFRAFKCQNSIYFLNKEYEPLKALADECDRKLKEAEENLRKIKENLELTQKTKEEKTKELEEANATITKLNNDKERCIKRRKNAEILKASLGTEKEEWQKKKLSLEEFSANIVGDILMSAGIVSYLGAFTKTYREDIVLRWATKIKKAGLPISFDDSKNPNDIMRSIIGDPMEIEQWKTQKLPNDNFSADNALIMTQSRRFCLLIDPQNQALQWLKEKIKVETEQRNAQLKAQNKGHEIKKGEKRKDGGTGAHYTIKPTMTDALMADIAVDCCQNGRQLIFENAGEELPQIIAPIYKKEFVTGGAITTVAMNGKEFEVHPNFNFFIITQLPKPHYLPDICVALTIVNFTVTEEGLQDQMLNFLVEKDDPTLNALRTGCIDKRNKNELEKRKIEASILRLLDESQKESTEDNTILDNGALIDTLRKSNITSKNMEEDLKKQKDTEKKIADRRAFLSPVSVHVSQLFFTVCDLSSIEPVYQYSLKFYQDIFGRAIELVPKDPNEKDEGPRLEEMMKKFDYLLYDKICMSLFDKDKIVFSFLMLTKILSIAKEPEEKEKYNKEIRMFVTGGSGKETDIPNPAKDDPEGWITQVQWNSLCEISQSLSCFKDLEKSFKNNKDDWKQKIGISSDPFAETFPEPFDKLTDFYKMIILRVLRPDKIVPALKKYVTDNIGEEYCVSPAFDIEKAYNESRTRTPILFIISPGADPLVLVEKLCKKKDKAMDVDVKTLSLGQGQEKAACDAIDKAQKVGEEKWILLQNCHLAKSFMNTLEKKIEEILDVDSSFRLFLTALPTKVLPISVIQDSIKIVNEPPRGLKQSLQRAFSTLDENTYDKAVKVDIYRRFTYAFTFFHALILERRKYGPLGWNIPYEFSNSDLSISLLQLKNFLE